MKNLRIAITGPAGSGKSTLLKALQESPYFKELTARDGDIEFIKEIVRDLKDQFGFKINEHANMETELMVLTTHLRNIILKKRFVTDRCLIDNYVYASMDDDTPMYHLTWNKQAVSDMLPRYDAVFYLPAEFEPPHDGVRNIGTPYYEETKKRFDAEIKELQAKYPKLVITITGSVEERVKKIVDHLQHLDNA